MDCELARQLLIFARPGATELDAADVAALETHIADCPDCLTRSRKDRAWDDRLASAMQAVAVPHDGRARLDRRLVRERSGWRTRTSAKVGAVFAVAAAVWCIIPSPQLNVDKISADAYDLVGNRDGVEEWLRKKDSRFRFPPRMNAKYLVGCERRAFHGVKAPVLTFVRQNAIATVAVVYEGQVKDLSELQDGRVAENSVCTVLIVRDPEFPEVVYVIEIIIGPVELFYNEGEATAT